MRWCFRGGLRDISCRIGWRISGGRSAGGTVASNDGEQGQSEDKPMPITQGHLKPLVMHRLSIYASHSSI